MEKIYNCPICDSENFEILTTLEFFDIVYIKIKCEDCSHELSGINRQKLINEWNKKMYKCPECNTPLNESMFCVKCCSKWTKTDDVAKKHSELIEAAQKILKDGFVTEFDLMSFYNKEENKEQKKDANFYLDQAKKHMADRAESYDNEDGERSMLSTVRAFSDITGICMTEEHGWLFMGVLKMVRSQQGKFKSDNYEDGCAYFALAGEAASNNRKK